MGGSPQPRNKEEKPAHLPRTRQNRTEEKLVVRVLQGYNLRGDDGGFSDTYAQVTVTDGDPRANDRQRKEKTAHALYETEVMKKNNNPSWHSVAYDPFKSLNIHPTSTGVRLSVWDWDAGSADDQLGKRSVTLKQLRQWSHDFAHEGEHVPAFEDDRGELSREGIVWLHHGDGLAAEVVAAVQLGDKGVSRLRELLEAGGSLFARNSCGDSAWTVVWSVRKNIEQGLQPAVPFQQMVQLVVRESCALNAQGESLVPQALDTRLSHGFTRKRLAMTEPGEPGMDVNGTDDPTRPQEVVLEYKFVSCDEYARRYMLPPARADDSREGAYKKEAKRMRKLEKERLKRLKRKESQDLSNATSAKPSAITDNGRPQTKPGATNGTKATLSKTLSKLSPKATLSKLSPVVSTAVKKFVGLHTNVSCPSLRLHVRGVGVHGWNGEPHCRGTYENELLLKTFFSKYGVVDHTTVRHRIADKRNTSWALVTMQDQAGVEAVLSAAKVDPGIICGTHRLHIERFQLSMAEGSTGMMKNIMEKDDYPNYQFQISVHNFKVEDTGHAAWKMLKSAFVQQSKSWRSAIQEPWDPHLDSTWVRPTHTTVGNASAFSCPYGPHDPKGIMTSVKKQKEAPLLGVVTVTVVSCTHLPQMDGIFANDGTGADPYVVCGVNNHIARTTVRMNTQDPEWPEEEGKMTLPITAPSDEVHIVVVDFDSAAIGSGTSGSAHDLIGRVWPPIFVRDLEYGEEKSFELQLHDCPEGFDFSAIDAQNKVEKWAMDAHSNRNTRGTVHIRLRYDITKPKVWANGDFKTRLKARAKVYKSYMVHPRIAAAPIEIKNFPVRERMDGMACIPKNVYLQMRRGYTEDYDLNYTMNLQYDTELKMGYASPFRGMDGIKGNLNRVSGLLEPFKVFGAGLKDVLNWKSIPWSLTVLYAWTYFMFNPGLILPFLVSLLFAKVAKEGLLRATGTTITVRPEKEGPWEAWEDARLWRMAHSSTLDSLVESSRWAAISKWVSHGDGGVRPIEACRERLAEIRANYTDSDSEGEEEGEEENDGEGERGVKSKKHKVTDTFTKVGSGAIRDKDRKRKKDTVEFLLRRFGLGHVIKHLQKIQNLLGLIASFGEKIGAICIFEDQIMSSIFLVLLALVAFLIYFIPLNYVVWAIGTIVLTKKSPLKGIVGQIKTVVPWLKSPPSDTELKHYWYALKYKNRAKYPDWPAQRLGCPLEEPLDFIWHAPSRARVGFGKRAHKDFHGWHQIKHETKLYEKRHAEREAAALRVLEKLETHVARTAPARPRPTSTSHDARRVMRASVQRLQGKDISL